MKLLQNMSLGKKIQEHRKLRGLSQMEVVARMHLYGSTLSESSYAKIEQGRRNLFLDDFVILKIILEFDYSSVFKEFEDDIRKRRG